MLRQLILTLFPLLALTLTLQGRKLQRCIPQSPPSEGQVPTAIYEDCIRTILTWGNIPGRDKPVTFSRNPNKGYQVPHALAIGECVFEIDMVSARSEETSSIKDVAKEAGLLAKECVLNHQHTGGIAYIGPKLRLEIILHGRIYRPASFSNPLAEWKYLGCNADFVDNGTIPLSANVTHGTSVTVRSCAARCSGFRYFGVELGSK